MLDLIDISVQFSGNYLFDKVNLRINPFDKIALIGSNGTGKSTLLKLIYGTEEPESGKILNQKGLKIGYLRQEFSNLSGKELFEEVRSSIPEIIELEAEENKINDELRKDIPEEKHNELIHKLGDIHHKKEHFDFYKIDSEIEKILEGLGFHEDEFSKKTEEFSGGWQMRIELAKILIGSNDLILLDEPTNHLDIDSLQWLINFLMNSKSALVVISHDRYFLKKITNKTWEVFNKNIFSYNGDIQSYLEFKEERIEQLRAEKLQQEKKIKETEKFIERFRYKATKARQVQSRIKSLEKVDEIEIPDEELNIEVRFPQPPRSGIVPMELKDISKAYEENLVLKNIDFKIERGEKIAFLGPNGAGKTTLAKIIAGKISPSRGERIIGHNTVISYYAQEVADELNIKNDILTEVGHSSPEHTPVQLRSILGSFLFTGDDVFKPIKVLSGGEKSRVALAKLLLTKSNLIILDEPTNHLDYNSKLVLQKALKNYEGAAVIVSHDIEFLRGITSKIVEIREKKFKVYYGDIDYYLQKRDEVFDNETAELNSVQNSGVNKKEQKRIEAELRQQKYKATKDLNKNISILEEKIEGLEEKKQELEDKLVDPEIFSDPEKSKTKNMEYQNIKSELESAYENWTNLNSELEEINEQFQN